MTQRSSLATTLGIIVVFTLLAAMIIGDLWKAQSHAEPYWIADWQINYAAGFVRRGLIGEVVRLLHSQLGVNSRTTIVVLQSLSFVVFFSASAVLLPPILVRHPTFAFAVFSPIALPFKALDLHPGSTGAKESVFLAFLALQAALSARAGLDLGANDRRLAGLGLIWVAMILVHEGFLFFLPFSMAVLLVTTRQPIAPTKLALTALPAILAFFISAAYHGDATYTAAICASLGDAASATRATGPPLPDDPAAGLR